MPVALYPANAAIFGITGAASDTFQSRSISSKFDKKEARGKDGQTIATAFYGKMAEHSVELLGTNATTYTLGSINSAPTGFSAVVGGAVWCVDELSINYTNDGFAQSTIKVSEYTIED